MPSHFRFWGKAQFGIAGEWHPLVYHMLDCAAVCREVLSADVLLLERMARASSISRDRLIALLPFVVACHDLGKFSRGFQSLRPDIAQRLRPSFTPAPYEVRHDTAGFILWRDVVLDAMLSSQIVEAASGDEQLTTSDDVLDLLQPWFRAVCGHHGQPPKIDERRAADLFDRDSIDAAVGTIHQLADLFGPMRFAVGQSGVLERLLARSAWLVAGVTVLCDWIGSNVDWFPYRPEVLPLDRYFEIACTAARRAIRESGLTPGAVRAGLRFDALFPYEPSPLQRFVDSMPLSREPEPELVIIEDVTGAGKTEAAITLAARLMAAGRGDGLYFSLPTMATSNQMFDRVGHVYRRLFETETSLVLTHSAWRLAAALRRDTNDAQESAEVHCSAWLGDGRKKAMLASVAVGTVDQALLAALPSRHNVLRLLGLHRKILIVDEVHSYDAYMERLLAKLLEFHAALGGSAILLSATLSFSARRALIKAFARGASTGTGRDPGSAFPLIAHLAGGELRSSDVAAAPWSHRRIEIVWKHDESEVLAAILEASRQGKAVCWIRNSVDDAIEAMQAIENVAPAIASRADLFHARFAMGHRLAVERRVLGRFGSRSIASERTGRIVVSTQVIEQSLDLDFDLMISDLAPIDLLIQRCGRLHRHARSATGDPIAGTDERGEPRMIVLAPPFDEAPPATWVSSSMKRTSFVYPDHGQLWLTMNVLRARGCIATPDDARFLIEAVYGENVELPDALQRVSDRVEGARSAERSLAALHALKPEQGYASEGTSWLDDHSAITRLAEPTVMFRLAEVGADGRLEPLVSDADCAALGLRQRIDRWSLCDVSIRHAKLSGNALQIDAAQLEQARATMPDLGKWCEVLPLRRNGDRWIGEGWRREPSNRVIVAYDRVRGLIVEETDALQPD